MPKGPSRIKVSLSRHLGPSEIEWINEIRRMSGTLKENPEKGSHIFKYDPATGCYIFLSVPWRIRLSKNQQLYFESFDCPSRTLFAWVEDFLEDNFINLHGVAVKTLRELG